MTRGACVAPDKILLGPLVWPIRGGARAWESATSNSGNDRAPKALTAFPSNPADQMVVVGQSVRAVEVGQGLGEGVSFNTATGESESPGVIWLGDRPLQNSRRCNIQVVATRARVLVASDVSNAFPGSAVIVIEARIDEHLGSVAVWRLGSSRGLSQCGR